MSGLLSLLHPRELLAGRRRRRGMSLMEVMIATVIVLGSVMALSRLAFLARRNAIKAEDRSQSQIHCQNIIEEILAGVRPLQKVPPTVFEGDQWIYSIDVEAVDRADLVQVTVSVDRLEDEMGLMPSEDEMDGYRLVRWVRRGSRSFDDAGLEGEDGFLDSESDLGDPLDFGDEFSDAAEF